MNIQEEAKQYADGRITSILEKALEDAYCDGYKKGYDNGLKKAMTKKDDDFSQTSVKKQEYDEVTFIDMGLPSGTLWATCFIDKLMTFSEAQKYSIPTQEQWKELKNTCLLKACDGGLRVISTEGNSIWLMVTDQYITGRGFTHNVVSFWLDEESPNTEAFYVKSDWYRTGKIPSAYVDKKFKGERLSVILVKTPE